MRHPALAYGIPVLLVLSPVIGRIRVPMRLLAKMRAIANDPGLAEACLADPVGAGTHVPLSFLVSWLRSERPAPPDVELPGCGHFPVEEPGVSLMGEAMAEFMQQFVDDGGRGAGGRVASEEDG